MFMTLMAMHLFIETAVNFVGVFCSKVKYQIIHVYLVPVLIHHSPGVCVHPTLTEREEDTCHLYQINDSHLSHQSLSDTFSPERASLYSHTLPKQCVHSRKIRSRTNCLHKKWANYCFPHISVVFSLCPVSKWTTGNDSSLLSSVIDKTAGGELGTCRLFLYDYSTHPSLFFQDTIRGQTDTDRDRKEKKLISSFSWKKH